MIEIAITEGQIIWLFGVLFILIALIPLRSYFTQYWYGTVNADDGDKIVGLCFIFVGITFILFGLNMDYKWIEIEIINS